MRTLCLPSALCFLLLTGCINEFIPKDIRQESGLLVVDGAITNDQSIFTLSRSVGIAEKLSEEVMIDDAVIVVESNDGVRIPAASVGGGKYLAETGDLDVNLQYRLSVDVDGEVFQSEYLSPILTAEIDSLFLTKDEKGAPVFVRISTDGGANGTNYYRWMYNETWEVMADFYANARWGPNGTVIFHSMYTSENTYYCWGRDSSKVLLLGDTEKLSQNIVSRQKILEIPCDDDRLSILYHIEARQMQLREAAYRYFADLQERIERTGDLFSPILTAGLRGNIRCAKDPERLVVGYIEVATTTRKDLYVWEREGFYEVPATYWASLARRCTPSAWSTNRIFSIFSYKTSVVYDSRCVDCRERAHASKDKPQGWPTEHW